MIVQDYIFLDEIDEAELNQINEDLMLIAMESTKIEKVDEQLGIDDVNRELQAFK